MINYKHLHYFWMIVREGGVIRASERLHLTPQTISGQLAILEESLGEKLFTRNGRHLELTEAGQMVLSYADEIFSLGVELEEMVRSLPARKPLVFTVGVADGVPRSIASRLLTPALQLHQQVRIVCHEGTVDSLLDDLKHHKIDLVIADAPIPHDIRIRGYNHALGECGISFFAPPSLARKLKKNFPQSLNEAPLLIPGETTMVRNRLLQWFDKQRIKPRIVGEFDDSALMKAFGRAGAGVFIAPSAIADEIVKQYDVTVIGHSDEVCEQFYAISVERKISHPAVAAISETAKEWLSKGVIRNSLKKR